MTTVFVPKETRPGETRIALSPETAKRFVQAKVELVVEPGAGLAAGFADAVFVQAGAKSGVAWESDVVLKVAPPTLAEAKKLKSGAVLVSFLNPARELELVGALRHGGITALAMELVPRISRAQPMDALSSQATVAGYKAVLLGASELSKMCPLLMTAAGTVAPAKVVVFGAGVAGLMAIATARRLGCVVEATDVRMAAKEQVESLGGRFITVPGAADMEGSGGYAKEQSEDFLRRQREEVAKRVAEADLVITTAQIPGKKAPVLVDAAMVRSMKPGAVIVDLAVESGGNCELSVAGQIAVQGGVKIVGIPNLPATVPTHASELYAKNVLSLVKLMLDKEGKLALNDFKDEVLAGCRLTHAGEVHHAPTAQALLELGRAR
ncbi:MAG: Re/Si-specific NAD(P)(+) transhydrogenase subunit alpha [Planctomycetota bacterium]